MTIDNQINRIKKKLSLAKKNDVNYKIFGSSSHKYALNTLVSKKVIEVFETRNNIVLPVEYKMFLIEAGNGGAGPYYGIYKFKEDDIDEYLSKPCNLHPNLTDEEWSSLTIFRDEEYIDDEQYEMARNTLFQGMLHIGTQGCTYEMMVVVSGEHKGRVVYIDEDFQKPFFTYEDNFLEWYERWLDEIIKGYDLHWFGTKMGGDDIELINKFNNSTDEVYKENAIVGMHKLPNLLLETIDFLENQCKNRSDRIKMASLSLLTKHSFSKAKTFLMELLKSKDEEKQLVALQNIHWYCKENTNHIIVEIKQLLPITNNAENFRFISYILEKNNPNSIEVYIEFFYHPNKEIRRHALYMAGKSSEKGKYIKDFIQCLHDEDPSVIHSAVQALYGVTDYLLLPHFEELLDKYKTNAHYIRTNVKHCLKEFEKLETLGKENTTYTYSSSKSIGIIDKIMKLFGTLK